MKNIILAKTKRHYRPFEFKFSDKKAYTMEEAVFIASKDFITLSDDLLSTDFFEWLNEIGLQNYSKSLKDICKKSDKATSFAYLLSISNLFSKDEIKAITSELHSFENRDDFDKYRLIAKEHLDKNRIYFAIKYYLKALEYNESVDVLNNLGCLYKKCNNHGEAIIYFEKALQKTDDIRVYKNLLESYIKQKQIKKAQNLLDKISDKIDKDILFYFKGEINYLNELYEDELKCYQKAFEINPKKEYVFKISDVFLRKRMYKDAEDFILQNQKLDVECIIRIAEILRMSGNTKKAISFLENNLSDFQDNLRILTTLVKYNRLSYNVNMSKLYLYKAVKISDKDNIAILERARLYKSEGDFKKYSSELDIILNHHKELYRNI